MQGAEQMAAPLRQQQESLVLAYPDDLYHFHNIRKWFTYKIQCSEDEVEKFFFFSLEWKIMECLDISITLLVVLKGNHIQRYPISANLWVFYFKDHLFDREHLFRMYVNYVQSAVSCLKLICVLVGRVLLDNIILNCTYTLILPIKKTSLEHD